jgi:predicted dehydrogenase
MPTSDQSTQPADLTDRNDPMRVAIVGCGRMGRVHAERLIADGRATIAAWVDGETGRARELQQELAPPAPVFADLETLLDREPPDAAIVCTPTQYHYDQVLACLDRRLHVLCEKPLADSRDRIMALIAEAEKARVAGRACTLGYQRRYWGVYQALREEIRSGQWGAIQAINSHNVENWQQTIAGTWRDDPVANPGGFIGDAGGHKIDSLFYVTGLAARDVFARNDCCGSRVEIISSVSARFGENLPVAIDFVGNAQYLGEDLHVHCAGADLLVRSGRLWRAAEGRVTPVDTEPDSNPVEGFLDVILDGADELSPFESALPVYDFTQAVLESGRTGRAVRLET